MDKPYTICWLGWNNKGNHDKIWGWLKMNDGRFFAFWGRRGGKLRFQEHLTSYTLLQSCHEKQSKKGYVYIKPTEYDNLVSDFLTEIEIYFMEASLEDKIQQKK